MREKLRCSRLQKDWKLKHNDTWHQPPLVLDVLKWIRQQDTSCIYRIKESHQAREVPYTCICSSHIKARPGSHIPWSTHSKPDKDTIILGQPSYNRVKFLVAWSTKHTQIKDLCTLINQSVHRGLNLIFLNFKYEKINDDLIYWYTLMRQNIIINKLSVAFLGV